MKKQTLITSIALIFLLFSIPKIVNAQWWEEWSIGNIHNTNGGDVFINTTLRWNIAYSRSWSSLSTDQGGSIELGNLPPVSCTPYIDFHNGSYHGDFNTRIINSADLQLEFLTGDGSGPKMTFNGTPSGPYSLPTLRLTNTNGMGNSFEFQDINGLSAIDFWHDGTNAILDFYADYQNHPEYNQFSVKRDNNYGNTCGWGNDESWLCGDREYLGAPTQGPSIHLNQAGSHDVTQPYISFSYGTTGNNNHNDVVLRNTGTNQLDIFTNTDKFGEGGNKIMSIKNDGIYAKKITVQSSWSDFVFKTEYNLKSLEMVEKFIQENGHLEGIPTEQEVKENGVELGEATSKLLQKIEELTLYVIEQNKRIKKLEEENEVLKK